MILITWWHELSCFEKGLTVWIGLGLFAIVSMLWVTRDAARS